MPLTFPSHQALEFSLFYRVRDKINPIAIFMGSVLPDFEVLLNNLGLSNNTHIFHSLIGLLILIIPFGLVLTLVSHFLIVEFNNYLQSRQLNGKIEILSKIVNYYFDNKLQITNKYLITATISIFIGGLSHFVLDLPSHEFSYIFLPFFTIQLPEPFLILLYDVGTLRLPFTSKDMNIYVHVVIWFIETLLLGLISVYYMIKLAKEPFQKKP